MSIRLKQVRKQKQWSLETLAEQTGLTKSYLSKVERGLSVPSIAVALKLAGALGVEAEELFSDKASRTEISITRSTERTSLGNADANKPTVQSIASGTASKRMLPFVVHPASEFVASAFKEHEGEEFLFVHVGSVEVAFPHETVELAAGDSLYFNALVPHKIRSIGPTQAEVLVVVSHDDD